MPILTIDVFIPSSMQLPNPNFLLTLPPLPSLRLHRCRLLELPFIRPPVAPDSSDSAGDDLRFIRLTPPVLPVPSHPSQPTPLLRPGKIRQHATTIQTVHGSVLFL
ncbi:hypothetical protein L2E82_39631 [Cichorium intybus]|uniref:Uncharacterized protein n=1 Tax=Cichorium intybus TaxID=13427 RepID=A0ACB9AKH0_CICIN|nr:hypothetical protein L2E82_39631 [Cichorium intybus]